MRAAFVRAAMVAALWFPGFAAAQSPNAQPHCTAVGGSGDDQLHHAGHHPRDGHRRSSRGCIRVAPRSCTPAADGTVGLAPSSIIAGTTDAGDTVEIALAEAKAKEVATGLFAILSYPVKAPPVGRAGSPVRPAPYGTSARSISTRSGRCSSTHGNVCFKHALKTRGRPVLVA